MSALRKMLSEGTDTFWGRKAKEYYDRMPPHIREIDDRQHRGEKITKEEQKALLEYSFQDLEQISTNLEVKFSKFRDFVNNEEANPKNASNFSNETPKKIKINFAALSMEEANDIADETVLEKAKTKLEKYRLASEIETADYQNHLEKTKKKQWLRNNVMKAVGLGAIFDQFVGEDTEVAGVPIKPVTGVISKVCTYVFAGQAFLSLKYNAQNTQIEKDESFAYDRAYLKLEQAIFSFENTVNEINIEAKAEGHDPKQTAEARKNNRNSLIKSLSDVEQELTNAIGEIDSARIGNLGTNQQRSSAPSRIIS